MQRKNNGGAPHDALQFHERHQAAPPGYRTDKNTENHGNSYVQGRGAGEKQVFRISDQRGGGAAEAVEQRHHLRHGCHLHGFRRISPDRCTDHQTGDDVCKIDDLLIQQSHDDCQEHTDHGQKIATTGGSRMAEKFQTKNKQCCSQQIHRIR